MLRSYQVLIGLLGLALAAGMGCGENGGDNGTGGTGGTGGAGGGAGGTGGIGGPTESKVVSLGCRNSVSLDTSILGWTITAGQVPIEPNSEFTTQFAGLAVFPESFLDTAQFVVPGGLKTAGLVSAVATVVVVSGATGDSVTLGPVDIPYTCSEGADISCDPANDTLSCMGGDNIGQICTTDEDCPDSTCVPGANTDCDPVLALNPCLPFVDIPTSDDEQTCADLDQGTPESKTAQWEKNGFCVTGPLEIGLAPETGTFTATDATEVLFGWAVEGTGATLCDGYDADPLTICDGTNDGIYDLPRPTFADPTTPTDLRVLAGVLPLALTCTMAVDSAGPDGVATCRGGANDGMACESNADTLLTIDGDNFCVGGDDDGLPCDPAETMPVPCAGGECVNNDCGAGSTCSPADQSSPTPEELLLALPIGTGGNGGAGGSGAGGSGTGGTGTGGTGG